MLNSSVTSLPPYRRCQILQEMLSTSGQTISSSKFLVNDGTNNRKMRPSNFKYFKNWFQNNYTWLSQYIYIYIYILVHGT